MLSNTDTLSPVVTPGPDVSESPAGAIAGAIAGALVGVMVVVVVVAAIVVVLLVVLVLRKRQRKSPHAPDTQERTVDNAIYAGSVSHNCIHGV